MNWPGKTEFEMSPKMPYDLIEKGKLKLMGHYNSGTERE